MTLMTINNEFHVYSYQTSFHQTVEGLQKKDKIERETEIQKILFLW